MPLDPLTKQLMEDHVGIQVCKGCKKPATLLRQKEYWCHKCWPTDEPEPTSKRIAKKPIVSEKVLTIAEKRARIVTLRQELHQLEKEVELEANACRCCHKTIDILTENWLTCDCYVLMCVECGKTHKCTPKSGK